MSRYVRFERVDYKQIGINVISTKIRILKSEKVKSQRDCGSARGLKGTTYISGTA